MKHSLSPLFGAAAVALLMAACSPDADTPSEPTPPVDTAPVPAPSTDALTSEGWGPLRIGMTRAEVVAALGEDANPSAVGGPDPESCDQFRPEQAPQGLLVMLEQGILTRISVTSPVDLATDRGLRVGDTAEKVQAAYGSDARTTPHKYQEAPAAYITVWSSGQVTEPYVQNPDARGIVYEIGAEGTVTAIHIGGPAIQYVEGCA